MKLSTRSAITGSLFLAVFTQASANPGNRPDAPTGLSASAGQAGKIRLSWPDMGNRVEGYNVYRDNSYHETVRATSYTDDQVAPGNQYTYSLVAFTDKHKFSEHSRKITIDTAGNTGAVQYSDPSSGDATGSKDAATQDSLAVKARSGGVPGGYNLVFSDEFNGNSLDTSKWSSKYRWGPQLIVNDEAQYYVDQLTNPDFGHQPFQFDGEHLTISAIPTPDYLKGSASNQPYLSGAMTTYNKFKMRYGYVEMRAKLPGGKGLWPAFWMLHQNNGGTRPEIDIVEYIGDKRKVAYNTYHWYQNNANLKSTPTFEASGPDYSKGFHTYAVRWEPGKLTWYVDGVERNTHSGGNVASEDMYILLNLALGGSWAGNPDNSTPFPAKLVVDYVRAYQP